MEERHIRKPIAYKGVGRGEGAGRRVGSEVGQDAEITWGLTVRLQSALTASR